MVEQFFKDAFEGKNVPDTIRYTAIDVCKKFNIRGLSDPMYISNVVAVETGSGDGRGKFTGEPKGKIDIEKVGNRLKEAYGTKIKDDDELRDILTFYLVQW